MCYCYNELSEKHISLWFHNPLTRYIQNPEGTAWQQAVLLLHNDEKWDIMRVGFKMCGGKNYENT